MESILTSIKKMLGYEKDDTGFDEEIIMHTNSVLAILAQLGVGPKEGFYIEDENSTWAELITEEDDFEAIKSYTYLQVRLLFDPPTNSAVLAAIERQIAEFEWRIVENVVVRTVTAGDIDNMELEEVILLALQKAKESGAFKGDTGPRGPKGDKGDPGATGSIGPKGDKGDPGEVGPQGPQGDKGADGAMTFEELTEEQKLSLKGDKGDDGPQGEQGPKGDDGYTPQKGIDYFDGEPGPQGPKGDPGYTPQKGIDYFDGEPGPQGPKGDPGYTPQKGLDYFDGAQGPQGIQGEQGPQGPQGDRGPQGEQGIQGVQGIQGPQGETGAKGDKGDHGEPGEPGKDGYTPVRGVDYWTSADKLEIFKAVYPVGAIYLSTVSASPATLFGFGTWTRIQDTFLLAAGSTYSAGSTGGSATHTLTVDQIPAHAHSTLYAKAGATDSTWGFNYTSGGGQLSKTADLSSSGVANTGGGKAHNNMPPYLAVYVWKRTA